MLGGNRATVDDLPDLTYTDQVVRKVLRLRPPAGALFREPTRDVTVGGYRIPEGTMVVLPQFALQTDLRYFDDPDTFRPERWADDLEDDIPDDAPSPSAAAPATASGCASRTWSSVWRSRPSSGT